MSVRAKTDTQSEKFWTKQSVKSLHLPDCCFGRSASHVCQRTDNTAIEIFCAGLLWINRNHKKQNMSSYTWSPGSMPFPADVLVKSYYPYAPKYGAAKRSQAGCANGLQNVYPTYLNHCQTCNQKAPSGCAGKAPSGFGGRDYYHPSGIPFDALQYGTREGMCDAQLGCLDPSASNYDKMSLTHCQSLCTYPQPKVCIAEPPKQVVAPKKECACEKTGMTAEQAIYSKQYRHSKAGRVAKHIAYHQQLHELC